MEHEHLLDFILTRAPYRDLLLTIAQFCLALRLKISHFI